MSEAITDDLLALRTIDGVELRLPVAGIGSRSYAFIIDWHIRLLAAAVWLFGGMLLLWTLDVDRHRGNLMLFALLIPAGLIYFGYHPLLEVLLRGRTPGKRIAGLRVVTADGRPAGAGALLIRNLFRLIDALPMLYGLGLAVMVFNRRHLRLGDWAAGTHLVVDQSVAKLSVKSLLGSEHVAPRTAMLIDELLRRWKELVPEKRRTLAQRLLDQAGIEAPALDDKALQDALRQLLKGPAA